MKIFGPSPLRNASPTRKKSGVNSASDSFESLLTGGVEEGQPSEVSETAPAAPLDSLLFVQEMPDDELQWKKAINHGRVTLDALDQLRNALLMGEVPVSMLKRLAGLAASDRPLISDHKLQAILDDIEMRAAIELAKLEMAAQAKSNNEI